MYTDDNNNNNDKDGEEKKLLPLMIENSGHQSPLPHRRKIRIGQGVKSGNWGNEGNTTRNL